MTWPIAAVVISALALASALLHARWSFAHRAAMRVTSGEAARLEDKHAALVLRLEALNEKLTIINNRRG